MARRGQHIFCLDAGEARGDRREETLVQLAAGVVQHSAGVLQLVAGVVPHSAGGVQLVAGVVQHSAGGVQLVAGVVQLVAGGVRLVAGGVQLVAGVVQLVAGGVQHPAGVVQRSAGVVQHPAGVVQPSAVSVTCEVVNDSGPDVRVRVAAPGDRSVATTGRHAAAADSLRAGADERVAAPVRSDVVDV